MYGDLVARIEGSDIRERSRGRHRLKNFTLFDPGYASFGLGVASASNSLDARLLDHIAPFLDIGGDEIGKLVRR